MPPSRKRGAGKSSPWPRRRGDSLFRRFAFLLMLSLCATAGMGFFSVLAELKLESLIKFRDFRDSVRGKTACL